MQNLKEMKKRFKLKDISTSKLQGKKEKLVTKASPRPLSPSKKGGGSKNLPPATSKNT